GPRLQRLGSYILGQLRRAQRDRSHARAASWFRSLARPCSRMGTTRSIRIVFREEGPTTEDASPDFADETLSSGKEMRWDVVYRVYIAWNRPQELLPIEYMRVVGREPRNSESYQRKSPLAGCSRKWLDDSRRREIPTL